MTSLRWHVKKNQVINNVGSIDPLGTMTFTGNPSSY